MKCAKCGYISFDHLSECKKCQTSMASAREGLGFAAARPAAPALLGSLLRDSQPTAPQDDHAADTEAYISFGTQEEISGALNEGFVSAPAEAARPVADPVETQEDFSLLDLSDEELELLIEQDASEQGEKEQIEPTALADGEGDTYPQELPSSPEEVSASLEIAMPEEPEASPVASPVEEPLLSFEDFLETDTPDRLDLAADSSEAQERPDSDKGPSPELEHAVEHSEARPGDPEKEFVIDLSESELDALLERLEGDTKRKA